jgi:integrative and conjugative element protein (TIGR02256 family)
MKLPIFTKSDGGRIEISNHALSQMLVYVQNTRRKREAGGILIGRYIVDSLDIVIDQVTVPMAGDRRERFSFWRDCKRHQQILDQIWLESESTSTYLGEWHTHPENVPTPSNIDIKNWLRQLSDVIFSGESLFFIIIGIKTLIVLEGQKKHTNIQVIGEYHF